MQEFKKRVKGLLALFLVLCLMLQTSGTAVYAGVGLISVGMSDKKLTDCVGVEFTDAGDGLKYASSGGAFTVTYADAEIADYVSLTPANSGDYNIGLVISQDLPVTYDNIRITEVNDSGIKDSGGSSVYNLVLAFTAAKMCTMYYDVNGGDGPVPGGQKCAISKGCTLPAYDVSKPGHSFLGWSLKKDGTGKLYVEGDTIPLADNDEIGTVNNGDTVNLYAIWSPYPYTAQFSYGTAGGNAVSGEPVMMEGNAEDTMTLPSCDAEVPYYHFAGWKLTGILDGNSPTGLGETYAAGASFSYVPETTKAVLSFEAVWEPNEITIRYLPNGSSDSEIGAIYKYDPSADPEIALSGNFFYRSGYTHKGWSLSADGSTGLITQCTADYSVHGAVIDVYAIWKANAYTIRFNGNGGTGTMSDQAGVSDTSLTLNKNQYTNVEQLFAGWSTSSSGTVQYKDQADFLFYADTDNQVVDLFAVWQSVTQTQERTQIGAGTVYLNAGQEYYFGSDGTYKVDGDTSEYPSGTVFYVPASGYYTISIQ